MTCKLRSFLSNIQSSSWKALAKSSIQKIVMGNEACDLDSAVCAVIYAYLLYSLDKKMEFGVVLPVLNIERKDYPLKTEVSYWFNKFSITDEMLTFRDDIDLAAIGDAGNLHLYLVDHNILSPKDANLEPCVVSVLDHHQLERTDTPVYGMRIEPVGSCATLVSSEVISKASEALSEDVARLLYGTILLDTVNLSESAKRVTPKDIQVLEALEEVLKVAPTDRLSTYEELISAKNDVTHLTSEEIFLKDAKVTSSNNLCVAVASVPMLVQTFLGREGVDDVMYDVAEKAGYDVIVLMGIDVAGEVRRDLAVISHRKTLRKELSSYLSEASCGTLQLESIDPCGNRCCSFFRQGNSAASRKVVLPLVKGWIAARM